MHLLTRMIPAAKAIRRVVPRPLRAFASSATTCVSIFTVLLSVAAIQTTAFAAEIETTSESVFRAGAATSNITPPLGTLRVGSFAPYPTVHVHDDLHARCLVLDDGKTTLALVVCDLLGLHRSVSIEARRLIEDTTGIPPENVVISATHTHSAGNALGTSRYTNEQKLDDYQQFLVQRIADGVRSAKNLLRPAEVAFGKAEAGENLLSRRWHLRSGKERLDHFGRINRVWKTSAPNSDYTHAAGPVDPHVYFIAMRELRRSTLGDEPNDETLDSENRAKGALIGVYSAYSAHYAGDTGPGHISADYFGMYSQILKQLLASPKQDPPLVAMMANATSGDIGLNYARFRHLKGPKGNYQRSRALADDLADRVKKALAQVTWKNRVKLDVRFREVDIAWRTIEPDLLKWAKNVEARAPRLTEGNLPIAARWPTTREFVAPLSYAGRVQLLAKVTEPAKIPLQVVRIGEICIGTTPCETYTEVGQAFQRRSPFAQTFMVQLNHGYVGYLPTPRHFALGGYSTWPGTNYLESQASKKIVDHLVEMASELKPNADQ
jgi:neutral ceramidase